MQKTPILIADYDPRWPGMFEQERARIVEAIGGYVVGIRHLEEARAYIAPLEGIGYEYVPEYEAQIPDRRYFRRGRAHGSAWGSTHHLHMAEMGGAFWERHLLFRDYLRAHPQDAARRSEERRVGKECRSRW